MVLVFPILLLQVGMSRQCLVHDRVEGLLKSARFDYVLLALEGNQGYLASFNTSETAQPGSRGIEIDLPKHRPT